VAHQIAEGEGAGLVRPLDAIVGNQRRHAARALAHLVEVIEEPVEIELNRRYSRRV